MENQEYSVLILGNFVNVYIVQFVKHLKKCNPNVHLYFWGYKRAEIIAEKSCVSCYDDYCLFDIKSMINSSLWWRFKAAKRMRRSFNEFVAGRHFDYVNIHYIKPEYFFLIDYCRQYASKLVLTPWGSDVYRVHGLSKFLVNRLFDAADYVTGSGDRFSKDFIRIFKVPGRKFVSCSIGSESYEYIIDNKKLVDTNEAKHQLGIDNYYVITCGYNANIVHRHTDIIKSIYQVKDNLPENLLLLFPFTYPKEPEYVQSIKKIVNDCGLKAVYFESFLDIRNLFFLRQATDMFIHVQPTDALSATLQEYILCEKKIINGSWLQYPDLIKNGKKPYFEVDKMENLGQAIVNAYHSEPIQIDKELFDYFEKKQWKLQIRDWDNLFSTHLCNR